MFKRIAAVVVVALVGAGCHYLDPGPGLGPNLAVQVLPPGAGGAIPVAVSAPDLPDGTVADVAVHLNNENGQVIATAASLPFHFTYDTSTYGQGGKVLFFDAVVDGLHRHGLGVIVNAMRFNQAQALGTHNSYHTLPTGGLANIPAIHYYEDPLDVQLQSQGVRQFELDVNVNKAPAGTFSVVHIQGIDEGTTCKAFVDCLNTIKTWSSTHQKAMPIGIQLELKNADVPSDALPYRDWTAADLDVLDATIRSVFPPKQVFVPDDLRLGQTTLPAAIATNGWPSIDSMRGQVLFVMDNSGTFRTWYRTGHPALAGRVVFTNADPGDDDAAFIKRNDPKGSFADIQSLIAQGYIVRTRADADTVEAQNNDTTSRDAAFASGSTWVSSDFVVPGRAAALFPSANTTYVAQIPGGTPARCNPINAPTWCTSAMVESLP
jgi:hypothetical protein